MERAKRKVQKKKRGVGVQLPSKTYLSPVDATKRGDKELYSIVHRSEDRPEKAARSTPKTSLGALPGTGS